MTDPLNRSPGEASPSLTARLCATPPEGFLFSAGGHLKFNDVCVASLTQGASPSQPQVHIHAEGSEVREHLEEVIRAKLARLLDPLHIKSKDASVSDSALLRSIGDQLTEGLGSVRLRQVQGLVRALHGAGRAALNASPLTIGRRYLYLRENLTPQAVTTRLALLTTYKKQKAPDHWKPGQVLILDEKSGLPRLSAKDFERLGYELFAGRAVRVDIVERVIAPSFAQKTPNIFPTLMHTFRCTEEEARAIARQLNLGSPREKSRPRRKEGDERRTRAGRNRSGGQKSAFRKE